MTPKELELFVSNHLKNSISDLAMRFQSIRDAKLLTNGRGRIQRDMTYEQAADVILGLVSSSARTAGPSALARRTFECLQDGRDRFGGVPQLGAALAEYLRASSPDKPLSLFLDEELTRAFVIFTREGERGSLRVATYFGPSVDPASGESDLAGIGAFLTAHGASNVGVIAGSLITSIREMLEADQKHHANQHKTGWAGEPGARPAMFAAGAKVPSE